MEIQPGRKGMMSSRAMDRSIFSMYDSGMRVAQNTVHWQNTKRRKQAQPYPGSRFRIQLTSFLIIRSSLRVYNKQYCITYARGIQ